MAYTKKRVLTFVGFVIVTLAAMIIECNIYFPDKIKIFDGEVIKTREGSPYTISVAVSNTVQADAEYNAEVKLFGLFPVKNVEVDVLPATEVIPCGKTVGIKLFTQGIMCVGTEKLSGIDGRIIDASKDADIKDADMIIKANGTELHTIEQFGRIVSSSGGNPISLLVERDNIQTEKTLTPVKTDDGYKLGIWVRDSTAGIGTITFIDKKTSIYGALGHPITDVDTGKVMPIDQGSISDMNIVNVKKGKRGQPGELCGVFDQNGNAIGVILKNTDRGIYGILERNNVEESKESVLVASKGQIHTGKAEIYANVDGDKVEKFEVEIVKIMKNATDDKNMVINVTDKQLIEKTGGIVQGMSGSPILQDGKIIGAITHVFVNDPKRGYGIFIENMLTEAETIK